jgi:hypothetical protein
MYYVMHKQENLTSTSIHLGAHDHQVVEGHFREVMEQVMVEEEESPTLVTIMLAIVLVASKTFLFEHLLNEDGEVLKGDKLCQAMDKFILLFSPNVWNLIASLKY